MKNPLFPEFPEYDDTLTIPSGWIDSSWHNNACPSITKKIFSKKLSIVIWCDYKDPSMRDFNGGQQFAVSIETLDELGEDHYEPMGWFNTFDNALVFANALSSKLIVSGYKEGR